MDQEKITKYNRIAIKVIGVLMIILAVLVLLGGAVSADIIGIIQGVLILVMGILLILLNKWGLYILGFLFFGTLAQLSTNIINGINMASIIAVVILVILFVYVYSQRKLLK